MTALLLIALAATIGLFLCEWAARGRRRTLETAMTLRDSFFAAATTLVSDVETPDSVVDLLEACANTITRPEVGRLLMRRALADRLPSAGEAGDDDADSRRFSREVRGMRPDARRLLAEAALQYAQAVSFNNMVLGGAVRWLAGAWLSNPTHEPERLMIDITPRLARAERASAAP